MTKKDEVSLYHEYCNGCGLCHSVFNVQFSKQNKGFLYPILNEGNIEDLKDVCPIGGKASREFFEKTLWGKHNGLFIGWSTDDDLRKKSSSGGVITQICCYLIENRIVDGIIQITKDNKIPYNTKAVISRDVNSVKNCSGSRYCESNILYNFLEMIDKDETYAFVGRPCDVSALRMYLEKHNDLRSRVKIMIAFFCAGIPSEKANMNLLKQLGEKKDNICIDLCYRGNGWPGYTTCLLQNGEKKVMTYEKAWGEILGRDIRKSCKLCIDGIGEMADISCGDAWYLKEDDSVDFCEHDGRNVVITRNDLGFQIVEQMVNDGLIFIEEEKNESYLEKTQKFQYQRRACMKSTLFALQTVGQPKPNYGSLNNYSKRISWRIKIRRYFGTINRVLKGTF